jgi:hypothetical protein
MFPACRIEFAKRWTKLRKTGKGQLVILGENAEIDWWNNYAKLAGQSDATHLRSEGSREAVGVADHL